ncbi:hypothetical protein QFC24_000800 [Naganishia onofrii]|uniref:Uncharacterized protein n=1 Tax=Naganishia onofrii TaxID=1851511 RepID=A0ACC2XU36_9TREE|nr:hypothetical protein QFC24_000800 [Naganishia onofrii]
MRLVSFARNPHRMTSTSRSVHASSEFISSVKKNDTHSSDRNLDPASRHPPSSPSLDIQELEVLGIQTWKGKAVFAAAKNAPIAAKHSLKHSTSAVIDLADQLIDLTLSPSPPSVSTSNANLVRPRGIPRFSSPSARTAYSPSKRRNDAQTHTVEKAVHPFFNQWRETQGLKSGAGRQEQTREASSYSWKKPKFGVKKAVNPKTGNPFVSPPASPTLSATSVQSSPIQPPPASQRPRFAPASSSSSSSSLSSISNAVEAAPARRRTTNKPNYQGKPSGSTTKIWTKQKESPSPKTSPLRIIAPTVKKSTNPAAQKTFKPAFHPSSKQGTTFRPETGATSPSKEKPAGNSPWKWSKWGGNQQSQRSPPQNSDAQTKPTAAQPKHIVQNKNPVTDPADRLIMQMQQLDLERAAAGEVVPEIDEDSYEFLISCSQVTQSIAIPQSDPDEASSYESLIASSQVSQPAVVQPTSQAAVARPTELSPGVQPTTQPRVYAPSKPPQRNTMFSYKTYHIGHPFYKKPPTKAYTADPQEANELLSMIKGNAIAFDMEWPFTKGRKRVVLPGGKVMMQGFANQGKTALIQVGDDDLIVLVHLSMMKDFPSKLREIIENPKVYKLGVNVIGDAQKLVRDYGNLYMKGVLDLSYIARAVDEANCKPGGSKIALAKLCEQYTGCELDKGPVRQSDWSKRLSQAQMDYAANDVASTMVIYNTLMSLDRERGINVDLASLSSDLTPEMYTGVPVLQPSKGANANTATGAKSAAVSAAKPAVAGAAKSAANGVIKVTPTKMRAYNFFLEGKSTLEIAKAMRTEANPLQLNTVRAYLLDVVTTVTTLEYDKQRMYDILSEDVHPVNAQRNKACLVNLAKQLGKQIPRSPPPPEAVKPRNLVSSDIESSQEVRQAPL